MRYPLVPGRVEMASGVRGSGAANARVGREGEQAAARYLEEIGYRIRERNFRCQYGEIDLVAEQDEYIVFVEVKSRARETPYHPTLAMTEAKKRKVRQLGDYYCGEHPEMELQPRFDVVAVTFRAGKGGTRVEHFIDAF